MPSVATAGPNVYAVWHELRDGKVRIHFRHSADGGKSWDEAVKLSSGPRNSIIASVSATGSDVHVVWVDQREGTRTSIIVGPRTPATPGPTRSACPSGAMSLAFPTCPASPPPAKTSFVAWVDSRDGNEEEYLKISHDRGATWGKDVRMTNHPGNSWAPS